VCVQRQRDRETEREREQPLHHTDLASEIAIVQPIKAPKSAPKGGNNKELQPKWNVKQAAWTTNTRSTTIYMYTYIHTIYIHIYIMARGLYMCTIHVYIYIQEDMYLYQYEEDVADICRIFLPITAPIAPAILNV
jgi:hypothetical protein